MHSFVCRGIVSAGGLGQSVPHLRPSLLSAAEQLRRESGAVSVPTRGDPFDRWRCRSACTAIDNLVGGRLFGAPIRKTRESVHSRSVITSSQLSGRSSRGFVLSIQLAGRQPQAPARLSGTSHGPPLTAGVTPVLTASCAAGCRRNAAVCLRRLRRRMPSFPSAAVTLPPGQRPRGPWTDNRKPIRLAEAEI